MRAASTLDFLATPAMAPRGLRRPLAEWPAVTRRALSAQELAWLRAVPQGESITVALMGVPAVWSRELFVGFVEAALMRDQAVVRYEGSSMVAELSHGRVHRILLVAAMEAAHGGSGIQGCPEPLPRRPGTSRGARGSFFHPKQGGTYASHCAPQD